MKQTRNYTMLEAILKAEFQIQGPNRLDASLQLLDEAASLLFAMDNPKELEESLDLQTRRLLEAPTDQLQIFGLLQHYNLPENLYASVLAVLGQLARDGAGRRPIQHHTIIRSNNRWLEVLVESIAKGIAKEAKWLDWIRGEEARSLKSLGKDIYAMKESKSEIELQLALELGQEETVGLKFMTYFNVDSQAHASAVQETKKIQKAVQVGCIVEWVTPQDRVEYRPNLFVIVFKGLYNEPWQQFSKKQQRGARPGDAKLPFRSQDRSSDCRAGYLPSSCQLGLRCRQGGWPTVVAGYVRTGGLQLYIEVLLLVEVYSIQFFTFVLLCCALLVYCLVSNL